jgi:hypothetical protein
VLDFLVTSKARRRLLVLLWSEDASGSASQLATLADVGFASAYRELQAMRRLELVKTARRDGATSFSANRAHPLAGALERLLVPAEPSTHRRSDDAVRERVSALGAPVIVHRTPARQVAVEETLVDGVALAHKDPALARSLPVAFYRQRDHLDPERLATLARASSEKAAVGLFLDLTAKLSGDERFAAWARTLRDRRVHATRPFFYSRAAALQAAAQRDRSPAVARRWGYRLDMDLDDFRSLFEKARRAS